MTEEYWVAVLKEEDRLLSNSDRKYRYHCNSLESMSEELTFQERCFYIQEDFTVQCEIRDFIDTIQNERLAEGLAPMALQNIWRIMEYEKSSGRMERILCLMPI